MESVDLNESGSLILEEEIEEGYEPSEADIYEYAKYLGMELPQDQKYVYLAKEGLKAPLPEPWKPYKNRQGEISYINVNTREFVTEHPCDFLYKKKFAQLKAQDRSKEENSVEQNEKHLQLARQKISRQIDQTKNYMAQQKEAILHHINHQPSPALPASGPVKPQRDILDSVKKNSQVLGEMKQMVDHAYNIKINDLAKQNEQEITTAQKKIQQRYKKEEERLQSEYDAFVAVQQENKKFSLSCQHKQDRDKLEKDVKQQQLQNYKASLESLRKKYQVEKSAAVVNLENQYAGRVKEEQAHIQDRYDNQVRILQLKIKKMKNQLAVRDKQMVIQQERVRTQVENYEGREARRRDEQNKDDFQRMIERRQSSQLEALQQRGQEDLSRLRDKLEMENGVRFTQKDKRNLEEISMMHYKLGVKELTHKNLELSTQQNKKITIQMQQELEQRMAKLKEERVKEQQVYLDRLGAEEAERRARVRVVHTREVQQKYQAIKANIRNQIEGQKVALQSQIATMEATCTSLEQENQRLLKGLFHTQVNSGLRQFRPAAIPKKREVAPVQQQHHLDEFMHKTEMSLSHMCKEIHQIKDTLKSNLEQLSAGKESQRQEDLDQTVQYRHRQVQQQIRQAQEEEEEQQEDLNGKQNHWLQVAITSKRELRQYQDNIHATRQEVNDLTEQVRYCQFRYNQEKQRHMDNDVMPQSTVKDQIMAKIQNNIKYLTSQIEEKGLKLKALECFHQQKENSLMAFEQSLDRMVDTNTIQEDKLHTLHQAYTNIKMNNTQPTRPAPTRPPSARQYLVTGKYQVPKNKPKRRQQSLCNRSSLMDGSFYSKESTGNCYVRNNVSFNIQNNREVVGEVLRGQSDWLKNVKHQLNTQLRRPSAQRGYF